MDPVGDVDTVAGRIREYREAGVTGFSLATSTPDHLAQIEPLAAVRAEVTGAAA